MTRERILLAVSVVLTAAFAILWHMETQRTMLLRLTIIDYAAHRDVLHELLRDTKVGLPPVASPMTVTKKVVRPSGPGEIKQVDLRPLVLTKNADGSYAESTFRTSTPYILNDY
jgi:hypothetical protein